MVLFIIIIYKDKLQILIEKILLIFIFTDTECIYILNRRS